MPCGMAKKKKKILPQPEDQERPGTPPSSPDLSGIHPGCLLTVPLRGLAFGETKIPSLPGPLAWAQAMMLENAPGRQREVSHQPSPQRGEGAPGGARTQHLQALGQAGVGTHL